MRRLLLILGVLSFPGWPQPSQQPAQPPIVVKVEMPPPTPRDVLGCLQALGPLIAASVALAVGVGGFFWQWHLQNEQLKMQVDLQRQQLKLDLYDRRYEVYQAVISASDNLDNAKITAEQFQPLFTAAIPAAFLFTDQKVLELIKRARNLCEQIQRKALLLQDCGADPNFKDASGGATVAEEMDMLGRLKNELRTECGSAHEVFRPHLMLAAS